MRLLTHVVFGAGAAAALSQSVPVDVRLYVVITLSVLINPAIDWLGHFRKGQHVSRSPLTHSVLTAPIWGGAIAYALWWSLAQIGGPERLSATYLLEMGVVIAFAHLLLDAMTERGVFVLDGRFALAHFRSGNGVLNGIFLVVGAGLFLV